MKSEMSWKVKDQNVCAVLIKSEGKVYQVVLNKEQMKSIIFILPQLFDNHRVKILKEPLNLEIKENK